MRKFAGFLFFSFLLCGSLHAQDTLRYASPGVLGIDSAALHAGIEDIVHAALDSAAFPGCQILLAKGNTVFYHQGFGYHRYDGARATRLDDIYDLASVTKVMAATLSLMKLYDDGRLDIDKTLGYYFPFISRSDKSQIPLRKVLAHQAQLKSWIAYYQESKKKSGSYKGKTVSEDSSAAYPYRIPGSALFLHKDYFEKKILKMIAKSPLYDEEKYVYSGLSFYLFPMLVERISGKPFEQFLNDEFYAPMGAETVGFNPTERFSIDRIVPTEVDTFFRMQPLHGVVHDEGAAMMLGVSGNAGLFGTAGDLAKLLYMLLNEGEYNGVSYLSKRTIEEFTQCQYCHMDNRRGLGFDKPLIEYDSLKSSVAQKASADSFGHSGYTGTMVWADPKNDLIFIFLSNRVYPTRANRKLYELNVRPAIHALVYDLLTE